VSLNQQFAVEGLDVKRDKVVEAEQQIAEAWQASLQKVEAALDTVRKYDRLRYVELTIEKAVVAYANSLEEPLSYYQGVVDNEVAQALGRVFRASASHRPANLSRYGRERGLDDLDEPKSIDPLDRDEEDFLKRMKRYYRERFSDEW